MSRNDNLSTRIASHDRFFIENYDAIREWALQITSYNQDVIEDLVHDVYLKIAQRNNEFAEVASENGYLYVALKNAYHSYLRSKMRNAATQMALSDHQEDESALAVFEPGAVNRASAELRAICEFACLRKAKSISGSIIILRFFHGYQSAEVARIVNRPINTIEVRLRLGRREVSRYVNHFWTRGGGLNGRYKFQYTLAPDRPEPLDELRAIVFSSVVNNCIGTDFLKSFYRNADRKMDREDLAHVVSCAVCLDNINDLLGIPRLNQRHPLEIAGSSER